MSYLYFDELGGHLGLELQFQRGTRAIVKDDSATIEKREWGGKAGEREGGGEKGKKEGRKNSWT